MFPVRWRGPQTGYQFFSGYPFSRSFYGKYNTYKILFRSHIFLVIIFSYKFYFFLKYFKFLYDIVAFITTCI